FLRGDIGPGFPPDVPCSSAARYSFFAAIRCCAAAVKGGILPSGGSIIMDVRVLLNREGSPNQCSLYARATSFSVPVPWRLSRPGPFDSSCSRRSSAAISSFVKNSRVPNCLGRSSGVTYGLLHIPCRSGSPHGVLRVWPETETGDSDRP